MKVKILKNCRANRKSCTAGKIVDLPPKDAKILLSIGKAELPDGKKKSDKEGGLTVENSGALVK